jgi:hypothetical protein
MEGRRREQASGQPARERHEEPRKKRRRSLLEDLLDFD